MIRGEVIDERLFSPPVCMFSPAGFNAPINRLRRILTVAETRASAHWRGDFRHA
ncbi:hypothetical protein [Terrimicrobium sacchariphilum]|uniref:hypothetical protein n=1 Tax=Terrimicrobium sacchariphilum TaxID=690879 RepID=UPI0014726468|nr:hypothetical protein [Terrimicrobium sacchariphilum]